VDLEFWEGAIEYQQIRPLPRFRFQLTISPGLMILTLMFSSPNLLSHSWWYRNIPSGELGRIIVRRMEELGRDWLPAHDLPWSHNLDLSEFVIPLLVVQRHHTPHPIWVFC
jgi:hypothetical protein